MPAHLQSQFEYLLYAAMTGINVFISLTPILGKTIGWVTDRFAFEAGQLMVKPDPNANNMAEAAARAADEIREEVGSRRPFGKVVGLIERQIYIYAAVAHVEPLYSAVILFKAFFTWLDSKEMTINPDHPFPAPASPDQDKKRRMLSLARYYAYAIGNFLSLAWALLIFETVLALVKHNPSLAAILIIGTN